MGGWLRLNNFISTIRTDRRSEMKKCIENGYLFIDEKKYRYCDKIIVSQGKENWSFGVQATEREVYFYITEDGANAYLSITEIYELLLVIAKQESMEFVVDSLKEQLATKIIRKKDLNVKNKVIVYNQERFRYRDIEYYITKCVELKRSGNVTLDNSSIEISYEQLFTLINLIQQKSNALFYRGKENRKYGNGLIRFLIVLLSNAENIPILNKIGWKYDNSKHLYIYSKPKRDSKRNHQKYYLTQKEYDAILKSES